jgi:4-hydroxybenzoate polyprenyltransferase
MVAFAVWLQTFTVWLFTRAWCLWYLQLPKHQRQAITVFVLVGIMQLIVLAFSVWAVIKFFAVLLKRYRLVSAREEQPEGKPSRGSDILCIGGLSAILVLAIFLAVWGGTSLVPAVVNVTFRIAWGVAVPGLAFGVAVFIRELLRASKEGRSKSSGQT